MRSTLARGHNLPRDRRTPDDDARLVAFRVVQELLRLLAEYERRIAHGERCRIVEREQVHTPGKLVLEFGIEVQP